MCVRIECVRIEFELGLARKGVDSRMQCILYGACQNYIFILTAYVCAIAGL
jgi:hypothetical protein